MSSDVLFDGETQLGRYKVINTIYTGRSARVLYSGEHQAAQSGLALDGQDELLFDYNQRFMELIMGVLPKSVLIIGGGAFTLPKALIETFPDMKIDVVELDGDLQNIAEAFFDFHPNKNTRIYTDDGRHFLDTTSAKYDVIIIDAFHHTDIPASLQTVEAAATIKKHLKPKGIMAMNIIASYRGARSAVLRRQIAACQTAFKNLMLFPAGRSVSDWFPDNYILTAQNTSKDLQPYLRHTAVTLLAAGADDALHDDKTDS